VTRLLVIKLGALGDVVLALAALRRIREAHPGAEITALTTPTYGPLLAASPYVDRVETDGRPKGVRATAAMLRRLRRAGYARIYDLQTSSRSDAYFQALRPNAPPWSGTAPGCALPHRNPERDRMHTLERQADHLKDAGIWPDAPVAPGTAPPPDLSWLLDPEAPARFGLSRPYALLVPGGSAHRPEKRWPAERYAELATALTDRGLRPAVLGGPDERGLAQSIPAALDLTGRTTFSDIAALGAEATLAVGNDTGPSHLLAAAGAPLLTLFSAASNPALTAPRGRAARVLQRPDLADLQVSDVLETLNGFTTHA
jgi:ADP-heptose:LPS heptosyltransferase